MGVMDVAVIGIFMGVCMYFIGYYRGKTDSWTEAYRAGEKSGWMQAKRREL